MYPNSGDSWSFPTASQQYLKIIFHHRAFFHSTNTQWLQTECANRWEAVLYTCKPRRRPCPQTVYHQSRERRWQSLGISLLRRFRSPSTLHFAPRGTWEWNSGFGEFCGTSCLQEMILSVETVMEHEEIPVIYWQIFAAISFCCKPNPTILF